MPTDKQSFLLELQSRLGELVRTTPAADIERNMKALLGQAFQRLELVTREEFDAYAELLGALRDRVARLEDTVSAIEQQSSGTGGSPDAAPPPA
jgi:BMFP domain-containing protein YqiC